MSARERRWRPEVPAGAGKVAWLWMLANRCWPGTTGTATSQRLDVAGGKNMSCTEIKFAARRVFCAIRLQSGQDGRVP